MNLVLVAGIHVGDQRYLVNSVLECVAGVATRVWHIGPAAVVDLSAAMIIYYIHAEEETSKRE